VAFVAEFASSGYLVEVTDHWNEDSKSNLIVDVVLATTGRSSRLKEVLDSLLNQTFKVNCIYIIWNSLAEPFELEEFKKNPRVIIKVKHNVNGAASAYNYGIKNSIQGGSNFICLAADDDIWELEKIDKQMRKVSESNIVFTSATFTNEFHKFKRPKVLFPKYISPVDVFYTKKNVLTYSKHYLPISSAMFPVNAARHLFNENLVVREDIEWLQQLHLNGFEIVQMPEALINVGSDSDKASKRECQEDIKKFLEIIVSETTKHNFLLYTLPRSSVLAGDFRKLFELHNVIKTNTKLHLGGKLHLILQIIVCFAMNLLRKSQSTSIFFLTRFRSK
jgi:glycosyltransferase involved in cell wall biosynthesis